MAKANGEVETKEEEEERRALSKQKTEDFRAARQDPEGRGRPGPFVPAPGTGADPFVPGLNNSAARPGFDARVRWG
jgi:hypothetical protein